MRTRIIRLTVVSVFLCPCASAQWVQTEGPCGGYVVSLAVSGTNLFAGTYGGGVFHSTDNGTSWTAASAGLTNGDVRALAISETDLFAGTYGGGVFHSTDNGTSWTVASAGLANTNVQALGVSGTHLFAGTSGGWGLPLDGQWCKLVGSERRFDKQ